MNGPADRPVTTFSDSLCGGDRQGPDRQDEPSAYSGLT
jgi:hypothetical protein